MVVIRDAQIEDVKSVTVLINDLSREFILPDFSPMGRQIYLESHSLAAMEERFGSKNFEYQVACKDENIIAVVGIRDRKQLFHLHVAKPHQRKGLAKQLWNLALARIPSSQKSISVNSSRYATAIYQKLGFTAIDTENIVDDVIFIPMIFRRK